MSIPGTNTYLVSSAEEHDSAPSILIDTGEGREEYPELLRSVLDGDNSEAGPLKKTVSDM